MAFKLDSVVPWGRNKDYDISIVTTDYEFQKGDNKLLNMR